MKTINKKTRDDRGKGRKQKEQQRRQRARSYCGCTQALSEGSNGAMGGVKRRRRRRQVAIRAKPSSTTTSWRPWNRLDRPTTTISALPAIIPTVMLMPPSEAAAFANVPKASVLPMHVTSTLDRVEAMPAGMEFDFTLGRFSGRGDLADISGRSIKWKKRKRGRGGVGVTRST